MSDETHDIYRPSPPNSAYKSSDEKIKELRDLVLEWQNKYLKANRELSFAKSKLREVIKSNIKSANSAEEYLKASVKPSLTNKNIIDNN